MKQIGMGQFIGVGMKLAFRRRALALGLLLALIAMVAYTLLMPLTYKFIFDDAIKNNDKVFLLQLMGFMLGIFAMYSVAGVFQDYATSRIGSRIAGDLQEELFAHLQKQPSSFYTETPESEIVAAFGPDITAIELAIVRGLPSFLLRLMTIVLSVALLFVIEWRLALFALCTMPLIFLASKPFGPKARAAARAADDQQAAIAGLVQENILINLSIRTFNLQAQRLQKLKGMLEVLLGHDFRSKLNMQLVGRAAVLASGILQIGVLGVGAYLAVNGNLSSGSLIAFIGLLLNVGGATDNLTQAIPLLVQGASGYSRIQGLLAKEPAIVDREDAATLPPMEREISLKNVNFGYTPENQILKGVSLSVPAGKKVAIVGGSGSGKSTVLSLMMRLYDPQTGDVRFDDMSLRDSTEASLRQQTGVVLQNTALFNTSIRENIRMGNLSATDAEIEEAGRLAGLDELIDSLPDGYDTSAGSQGSLLSGGQRQRVAIARAFLRKPTVLFLDEATSALDANTEAAINETLSQMALGWTLISVTHRLAHITGYDLIHVMDKGVLAESGSHDELLAKGGMYAGLWNKQSGFTIDEQGMAQVDIERLRSIPFLAKCSDELLTKLAADLHSEQFQKGRVVFEEGDPGDKFYILARGKMEAYVHLEGTVKHVLEIMEDGDHFGELALIRPVPRTWSVQALTDCVCLTLNRADFEELMAQDDGLREEITTIAYARMATLSQSIMKAAGLDLDLDDLDLD